MTHHSSFKVRIKTVEQGSQTEFPIRSIFKVKGRVSGPEIKLKVKYIFDNVIF